MKEKSLAIQAGILASAGLTTKIIGFVYRIPMANILGNTGNGIYSVAFGIYGIVLTLSSYSMPISVSKLVSEKAAVGSKEDSIKVFRVAMLVSVIVGAFAAMGLYFGADGLAGVYNKTGLEMPLKVLAPTTFIVSVLGCFRGYFQGYGNMVPTALSQIIEQIINAVVSIIAAGQITVLIIGSNNEAALRAMGGTMGNTVDDYLFADIMSLKGFKETYITDLQGVFNTQYTQMINLPIGMATAFGVSVIPKLTTAFSTKNKLKINHNIAQLIKMTGMVVLPAAAGLTLCSDEIMRVLFPNLRSLHNLAANLLLYGSISAVLYSFSTISTSILQGCNYFKVPVINSGISLGVHIVLVVFMIKYTDLRAYGLLIGDIIFPLLILILNAVFIKKKISPQIHWKNTLLKPLVGTFIMGMAIITFKVLVSNTNIRSLFLLVAEVVIGIVVYGGFTIKFLKEN